MEKAKVVSSSSGYYHVCLGLHVDLDEAHVENKLFESENIYLRVILSWVSGHEPQLGLMIRSSNVEMGLGLVCLYPRGL